jgi:hypothetical protein
MPAIGLAGWAAIAALAGTGATLGNSIYNKVTDNSAATLRSEQQATANQKALTEKEAVLGQQGNTQAATGGSLTDSGFQDYAAQLAGYPGYKDTSVLTTGTGTGTSGTSSTSLGTSGTSTSGTTSSNDLTALLAQLNAANGGNISGGTSTNQAQSATGRMELATPFV